MADREVVRVRSFSLYEDDLVNRLFAGLGLGARRSRHLLGRCALLIGVTWLPLAILVAASTPAFYSARIEAANFFADFAAYAQFLIGLPLFVLAEAVVGRATHFAGQEFAQSGVVRFQDLPQLDALHARIERLRVCGWSDVICLIVGSVLSAAIIYTEFLDPPRAATWHTYVQGGARHLSAPGYFEFFVALPLLNYWWLRQVWKVLLWCRYLYGVSRVRLALVATHPDHTGGIGFISEVQGHFAWMIFAYGISNVAATVGYKLALEHAQFWVPPVWGPILGFVIGAPLLFLLPLFMFTRQLYRAKKSARRLYRRRVMEHARLFETAVLPKATGERTTIAGAVDLNVMAQFSRLFDACEQMRVVPFDFRSMAQLFASTLGTVASILAAVHMQGTLSSVLEAIVKIVQFFGKPH